jgi:hypothetical protein
MSTRLARWLLGSTLLAAAGPVAAKPPDLPLRHLDTCQTPPPETAAADDVPDARKEEGARHMFQIAEKCLQAGDRAMARNCYEETRLLCPDSRYARLAAERLKGLDDDSAETQDRTGPREKASDQLQPRPGRLVRETQADLRRLAQARVLYALGERCRAHDDYDMAYQFYRDSVNVCPASRFAQKSAERMREIDARRAAEAQGPPDDPPAPHSIEPSLPPVDPMVVRWLERVAEVLAAPPLPRIVIELEQGERPAGSQEEQEPVAGGLFPQTAPPPLLFIARPVRDLVLGEEPAPADAQVIPAAAEDLSDWLRQAVRMLRGSGTLRVDAARLARLMGEGERALRELGCSVVHTRDGRCFVVYPADRAGQ